MYGKRNNKLRDYYSIVLSKLISSCLIIVFLFSNLNALTYSGSEYSGTSYVPKVYEGIELYPLIYDGQVLYPLSYGGSMIDGVLYEGFDLNNYKISVHTITGNETSSDFFDENVSEAYRINWKKVITKYSVGTTIIVITGILSICSGTVPAATVGYIATGAFEGATIGSITGAVTEALITGTLAFLKGEPKSGIFKEAIESSADGFMWGAITGAVSGGFKSAKDLSKGTPLLNKKGKISFIKDAEGRIYPTKGGNPVGHIFNYPDKDGNYHFYYNNTKLYDFDGNLITDSFGFGDYHFIYDKKTKSKIAYVDKQGILFLESKDIQNALKKDWDYIRMAVPNEEALDFLLIGYPGNGQTLKSNYEKYFEIKLPMGTNAHHIVPTNGGGASAEKCRSILKKFDVDINSPYNCAPLPSKKDVAQMAGTMCHNGYTSELHGNNIMQSISEDLGRANSREQVIEILNDYRNAMLSNNPFWK